MEHNLFLYNSLKRTKQLFKPLHEGHVGMYVCGPTVYGDAHLGHARPAITFDILFRYLRHLGYKVRYVRNITDVSVVFVIFLHIEIYRALAFIGISRFKNFLDIFDLFDYVSRCMRLDAWRQYIERFHIMMVAVQV